MVRIRALVAALILGLPGLAQAQDTTLADLRQELSTLYIDIQNLKSELTASGGLTQGTVGNTPLERLNSIEARLEASAPTGATGKKLLDKTSVLPQGVKMNELEQGTQKIKTFEGNSPFKPKSNKTTWIFVAIGVVLVVTIIGIGLWIANSN